MCLLSIVSINIATFSAPAKAQHMNAIEAPCKAVGSGAVQAACLNAAAKKVDGELHKAYERIRSVLDGRERLQLESSQRAWLHYRDQFCNSEYDLYGGGTAGLSAHPACLEALTRHHLIDLKNAYWWIVEKFDG